jgi:hypothetical protein
VERLLNRLAGALFLCALTLAVACGGDTATTTPAPPVQTATPTRRPVIIPTTPAGWTPYSRSTYQIALPDSWEEVKLGEAELKSAIASAQESNPPLAEQLRALLDSGQHSSFTFYALDKSASQAIRNVSIAHVALEGANDLTAYVKAYADALPNVVRGSKVTGVQVPLRINGIDAAEIVYDISLVDSAGALVTLRGVQYLYLLESGDAYLVTVTGGASDPEKFMPLARQIGTSFVGVTP